MSVTATSVSKSFAGSGTGPYTMSPEVVFTATTEIQGNLDGVALTNGVDFTVDVGTQAVTTVASYTAGQTLVFYRVTAQTQDTTLSATETPSGTTVESALDKTVRQIQEAHGKGDRALKVPVGESEQSLPTATSRSSKWLGFDSTGDVKTETDAQIAARVQAELNISSGAVAGKGTQTFADAAARVLAAPEATGQHGVQLDDFSVWVGSGTNAGDWHPTGFVAVDDAAARAAAIPAYLGQLLLQRDTGFAYRGHDLSAGSWTPEFQPVGYTDPGASAWATSTSYVVGDYVTLNSDTFICIKAHTSAATDEPRDGVGYRDKWEPYLVKGYHWDYKRDRGGRELTSYIQLGPASLLNDWKPAIDYLQSFIGASIGGGSGNTSFPSDGTPYDDPVAWADATAYVAGDFRAVSSTWYRCILAHTSATANDQPGSGTNWETYWIAWPFDIVRGYTLEFGEGTYYVSGTLFQGTGQTWKGGENFHQTYLSPLTSVFPEHDYLIEGCYRDGSDCNSNFGSNIENLWFDQLDWSRAVFWCASQNSYLRDVWLTNGAGKIGIVVGKNADNVQMQRVTFAASNNGDWSVNILCLGNIKAFVFSPVTMTNCACGIMFENCEGGLLTPEFETTDLPIMAGIPPSTETHIYTAWADATAYVRQQFVTNGGSAYYCHKAHTSDDGGTGGSDDGAGDNEPGVGTDWQDFWVDVSGLQGGCTGLSIPSGSFNIFNGNNEALIRVRGNYPGLVMQGRLTTSGGASQGYTHYILQRPGSGNDDIWKIPLLSEDLGGGTGIPLDHGRTTAGFYSNVLQDLRSKGRWVAASPAGGATDHAKEQDSLWVTYNNPATLTGNGTTSVSMPAGLYEIQVAGTTWETATLEIQDEDGGTLAGFNAITADKTREYHHPGGSVDVIIAAVTSACDVDIYFIPLKP